MIMKIALLVLVAALSGCATHTYTYTYKGEKYPSVEAFHAAVDNDVTRQLSTVTPLPAPLTAKRLLLAIPSAAAFHDLGTRILRNNQGSEPTQAQKELGVNISRANFKNIKIFFDAVAKRNIYASTSFVEMETTDGNFAPSAGVDTLFMVAPAAYSHQWFYASQKHGKQIFSYDRSSPTAEGKIQAFIEAVQAQAIRE